MPHTNRIINVNITFRNIAASDALKAFATEKLQNVITKFAQHDTEVHAVLKVEKARQIAEVSLNHNGANFAASEESEDMYKSIDKLADALVQQLRRQKDKITSHHG